jgi:hypothetical protein
MRRFLACEAASGGGGEGWGRGVGEDWACGGGVGWGWGEAAPVALRRACHAHRS